MRTKSWILATAAAAAMALSAGLADAQDQAGAKPDGRWAEAHKHFQEMREHRMAELKTLLQLRPDQEAAFQAFAAALQPPSGPPQDMQRPTGELTVPQMLEMRAKREAERKARMDRVSAAILAFYGALTPEQQKAFDLIVRAHHMMGHGMGGPGMGGPGMWGHGGWRPGMDGRHHMDGHPGMGPPGGGPPPPPGAG